VLGQLTGITKQEYKCESGAGESFAKFIARQSRCVQTCIATARTTSGPYADCYLPYGGRDRDVRRRSRARCGGEGRRDDRE
jgi:hypothetical protein